MSTLSNLYIKCAGTAAYASSPLYLRQLSHRHTRLTEQGFSPYSHVILNKVWFYVTKCSWIFQNINGEIISICVGFFVAVCEWFLLKGFPSITYKDLVVCMCAPFRWYCICPNSSLCFCPVMTVHNNKLTPTTAEALAGSKFLCSLTDSLLMCFTVIVFSNVFSASEIIRYQYRQVRSSS